jgi:hypothetical protein
MKPIPEWDEWVGPPIFADVWQTKDFKSNDFGCVAKKGVMGEFFASVANKGVTMRNVFIKW